jgi:DNA polymerase-3 subunit gamma/tau
MVRRSAVPHALLFDGTRGTGKTTTARILAAALNCDSDDAPCGHCPSCKATFDGSSMDVIEIDAASNGLVDDIRSLRQQVLYASSGRYRIVILDEAHSMSTAAFNALLKTLEEPPEQTVFILCTTEPSKILDTVASRCMGFTFRRLTVADIAARLRQVTTAEQYTCDDDLLLLLAQRADGAMRDALMLLDQVSRVEMRTAEQYQRLIGYIDVAPALLTALSTGDLPAAFATLDTALTRVADPNTLTNNLTSALRDVLVLRCGGDLAATGTALQARQNLALSLDSPVVVSALKVLWQLKTQVRVDDARAGLELALVMLSEVLTPKSQKVMR